MSEIFPEPIRITRDSSILLPCLKKSNKKAPSAVPKGRGGFWFTFSILNLYGHSASQSSQKAAKSSISTNPSPVGAGAVSPIAFSVSQFWANLAKS